MTSLVKISAHCSEDKEVVIGILDDVSSVEFVLQNGETRDQYVYDSRIVTVQERKKE